MSAWKIQYIAIGETTITAINENAALVKFNDGNFKRDESEEIELENIDCDGRATEVGNE